jgi:hypothetical protein
MNDGICFEVPQLTPTSVVLTPSPLKHADDDSTDTLFFAPQMTQILMLEACDALAGDNSEAHGTCLH